MDGAASWSAAQAALELGHDLPAVASVWQIVCSTIQRWGHPFFSVTVMMRPTAPLQSGIDGKTTTREPPGPVVTGAPDGTGVDLLSALAGAGAWAGAAGCMATVEIA